MFGQRPVTPGTLCPESQSSHLFYVMTFDPGAGIAPIEAP
jgi:hypothetical protein